MSIGVKSMKMGLLGLVVAGFMIVAGTASAATVGFHLRPDDSPTKDTTRLLLEDINQLAMTVVTTAPDQVMFRFDFYDLDKPGLADSKIKEFFFLDSADLFSPKVYMAGSAGVAYTFDYTSNGGGGFSFTPDYDTVRNTGKGGSWAVNPGEFFSITFTLNDGKSLTDVWNGFKAVPLGLAVGIHVQDVPSGVSVKLENNPVPIPATAWLLGAGLVGLLGMRRKND